MKTLFLLLLLVCSAQAQKLIPVLRESAIPQAPRATRAHPCADKECVETFWEPVTGPSSRQWSEQLKPVRVDRQFAVPLYLASWPVKPFTVMGFVYVMYRPNTHNPQTSAVRAIADVAKLHGAEAVSLRPRKLFQKWYTAGTAIKWVKE